jgi:hypothetical protein
VFPAERVENVITGTEPSVLGHGTREMPVWGPLFSQITSDRDYGKVRLYNFGEVPREHSEKIALYAKHRAGGLPDDRISIGPQALSFTATSPDND